MYNLSPEKLFWIYLYISIIVIVFFAIAKCYFGISYFDKYLYTDITKDSKKLSFNFLLSHIVIYFIFGIIFTFSVYKEMLLKTIVFEILLIIIKDCNIYKISNFNSVFITIIVGYMSYLVGCYFQYIISNSYKRFYKIK